MRALALALGLALAGAPAAAATPTGLKLGLRDWNRLALVYADSRPPFTQPLTPTPGVLGFSGDGRLISIGRTQYPAVGR